MKIKKYFLGVLVFFLFNFFIGGQTEFKIQGKVTRNGSGVSGISINICSSFSFSNTIEHIKNLQKPIKGVINKNLKTGEDGVFTVYLPSGNYDITCICNDVSEDGQCYHVVGPNYFHVSNKNIIFKFEMYSDMEIIEGNRTIIDSIPSTFQTVQYEFGRIPIFSENECEKIANEECDKIMNKYKIIGANLGKPKIFCDLLGNPIYYHYLVNYKQSTIAIFGVSALGVKPRLHPKNWAISFINDQTLKNLLNFDDISNFYIPEGFKYISSKFNCNFNDIKLEKLLCLDFQNPHAILGSIQIKNTSFILFVDNGFSYLELNDINKKNIKRASEISLMIDYIQNLKNEKHQPLL